MRVAFVGSREFPALSLVRKIVGLLPDDAVVVSGGARGVDRTAEYAAVARGLRTDIYHADWDKHGKRAGFLRNHDIVKNADRVVAFWDGISRGTMHTVRLAMQAGKPTIVYAPDGSSERKL